jgi:transglutaminase-like putative cysteine protease
VTGPTLAEHERTESDRALRRGARAFNESAVGIVTRRPQGARPLYAPEELVSGAVRFLLVLPVLGVLSCAPTSSPQRQVAPSSSGAIVPRPDFERIDYAHPEAYVSIAPAIANGATVARVATEIRGETAEEKLRAIATWINAHLRFREEDAYAWRSVDQILSDGTYGGCADHSVVFGSLSRAVGIPTVWVKTMDADWIREFVRADGKVTSWRGHVFLEVFIHGRWMLFDATELTLQRDYDPRQRILPGNRYAYDKGGDPYSLVLSPRWDLWKQQTTAYFRAFALALLPVPRGDRLDDTTKTTNAGRGLAPPVYVVADGPYYQWVIDRCAALGIPVGYSFNTDFDAHLSSAVGRTLVIALVGDRLVLPEKYWPALTVISVNDLRREQGRTASGMFARRRSDGTLVYVLYGRDVEDLRRIVGAFPPEESPP